MRRRTILQNLLSAFTAAPVLNNTRAQAQTDSFPGANEAALKELASTVLPRTLGRQGTDKIASDFIRWVHEYKPGAEMQNGYGVTRVRTAPPASAAHYLAQLRELSASVLAHPDLAGRRTLLAGRLKAEEIRDLPALPLSGNIVVDLMAFYFSSSAANDLVYEAAISREACRGLANSSRQPAPLNQVTQGKRGSN
jgi:hypothetical protein